MKAVCWHGATDVRVDNVPDPKILNPHDAILKITATTICGSDLYIYDGYIPTMQPGDIIGHETGYKFMEEGAVKVPDGIQDEKVLPISDAFPTRYIGTDLCDIQLGDTVAVWGCGSVRRFAIKSAHLLSVERVIGIGRFPERLELAKRFSGADTINYEEVDAGEALKEMTGGRGLDACIDAVGLEAHGMGIEGIYDGVKQAIRLETDHPTVLRQRSLPIVKAVLGLRENQ